MIRIEASAYRWGLVAMTTGWILSLLVATVIAGLRHPGLVSYLFSTSVFLIGSVLCHQRPERSFQWWGAQVPVCARCLGIYAGAALSAIAVALKPTLSFTFNATLNSAFMSTVASTMHDQTTHARALVLTGLLPTALTLVYEWTTGDMPAHWVRAGTGVLLGAAVTLVIAEAGTWKRRSG